MLFSSSRGTLFDAPAWCRVSALKTFSPNVNTESLYRARPLRDSGFDLMIPGVSRSPLKPIPSARSRRTPRSTLQPQRSSRRTPKPVPQTSQRSSRRTPASSIEQKAKDTPQVVSASSKDERTISNAKSTKKNKDGNIVKKRKTTQTHRIIGQANTGVQTSDTSKVSGVSSSENRIDQANSAIALENTREASTSSTKKRKKRKAIGTIPKRRSKKGASCPINAEYFKTQQADPDVVEAQPQQPGGESPKAMHANKKFVSSVQPTTRGRPKGKKQRISLGKLAKSKGKINGTHPSSPSQVLASTSPVEKSRAEQIPSAATEAIDDPSSPSRKRLAPVEEESEVETEQPAPKTKKPRYNAQLEPKQPKPRGRPRKVPADSEPSRTTKPATKPPAAKQPRKRARSLSTSSIATSKSRVPEQKPNTIPIAVHHLSRPQLLNHLSDDEDILSAPAPFPKKSSVDGVDVLSQVCQELITKQIDSIEEQTQKEGNAGERAKLKRKKKVVETFRDELGERLFERVSPHAPEYPDDRAS